MASPNINNAAASAPNVYPINNAQFLPTENDFKAGA
jgi:hypothetical protein